MSITGSALGTQHRPETHHEAGVLSSRSWTAAYLRRAAVADCACALAAALLAAQGRFGSTHHLPATYLGLTCALPVLWGVSMLLAGAYDPKFIGLGSDEFRRVLKAAVSLAAGVAILSYSAQLDLARGYMMAALPTAAGLGLMARYWLRKRLHRSRSLGYCTHRVVAVGHPVAVADLVTTLRRERYHGLTVVAACLAGDAGPGEVASVPVAGQLDSVARAVLGFGADTVAVLACPEMDGRYLRGLAWELEKTGTDLCVAPALMDVAGPRTTIRPVAGLPLLHVDHPELDGGKQVLKGLFDKICAASALAVLSPLFAAIALTIKLSDGGPAFFQQTRVGKGGRAFTVYKFRTMVVDAEQRKALLAAGNEANGVLFKIRRDPRITRPGAWLRRWSLDELPQLLNVLFGDMSLVGPRPALPEEAARYGDHMRRRLAVKPGITGLWQVNGRSDLSWDEAERLDLRYVENWSFTLDLQILWKTTSAVFGGLGAY
jgi:exopolysaccharide biosynthesis polyprenyl glycosylphosphotransferase